MFREGFMKFTCKKTAALLAVLALSGFGAADAASPAPVFTLKGITVTANRQAERLQDVPATVQVVTEKEIKDRNIQNTAQAISTVTGVATDRTVEGGVSLRGYGSKNVLVLLDGQQMNSAWNGSVDWNMIPVDNIRKIEVVSGGQSALYGGRAVGGVINIITKTPKQDGIHGSANVSYGTNATVKQSYIVNGKKDKWTFGAMYESKLTNGFRTYYPPATSGAKKFTNISDMTTADGKAIMGSRGRKEVMSESYGFNLGYDFDDDRRITYKFIRSNYTWKYNDPISYLRKANGKAAWPAVDFNDSSMSGFYGTDGWRSYNTHSLTYNDQKDKFHVHVGMTDYLKDGYTQPGYKKGSLDENFDGAGKKVSYPSKTWNIDMNKRWNVGAHKILFGGSYGQDKFSETIKANISNWKSWNSSYTPTTSTRSKAGKVTTEGDQWLGGKDKTWALYLQDKWQISPKWTVYAGGRYDHYKKYDGYSQYLDEDKETFASASYHKFSPKLSVDYALDNDTNFYVSYGKSFNPPLIYQVYRRSTRYNYKANPDLDPETTTTWEVGVKKNIGTKTKIHADMFWNKTEDYIDSTPVEDYKIYDNVGERKTHGVEFSIDHTWSDKWSSYFNYTWQLGKIYNSDLNDPHDYDIPRHLMHTGVTYTNNPWTVHVDGMFISARNEPGLRTGHFKSADPYFLLNLDTSYEINKNLSVMFSVDNVLDRDYFDVDFANDRAYAADGRTYTISMHYSF